MNIVVEASVSNPFGGFKTTAETLEHKWFWWEEHHTPAFDIFDEVKPDIFMCPGSPSKAAYKCIMEREIPYITCDRGSAFTFRRHEEYESEHDKWNASRIRCFEFDFLFDSHRFYIEGEYPALKCDIAISCDQFPFGVSLCEKIGKYNIKVVNEKPWSVPQYLGIASLDNKRRLYNSATLVFVDTEKEACRVIACGSLPVFNSDEQLSDTLNGIMPIITDKNELDGTMQFTTQDTLDHTFGRLHEQTKDKTYQMAFEHLIKEIRYDTDPEN